MGLSELLEIFTLQILWIFPCFRLLVSLLPLVFLLLARLFDLGLSSPYPASFRCLGTNLDLIHHVHISVSDHDP
ncbi:hypothetical protein VNO80_26863 [Phaseolus coccineus]|uniref:Uncharacterized protein n=1 Tax=Phaseolus coccineus TaxID=3886 RepID=A0AAN9LIU0_PHACN